MEGITLEAALLAVLGNGLMGLAVWYAWGKLEAWVPWLATLDKEIEACAVAVLAFVAVQAPFWFGILMRYLPTPVDWRTWLAQTFFYAGIAYTAANVRFNAAKSRAAR